MPGSWRAGGNPTEFKLSELFKGIREVICLIQKGTIHGSDETV